MGEPGGRSEREGTNQHAEDVRKYAAEQGMQNAEAMEAGMREKPMAFVKKGAEFSASA